MFHSLSAVKWEQQLNPLLKTQLCLCIINEGLFLFMSENLEMVILKSVCLELHIATWVLTW